MLKFGNVQRGVMGIVVQNLNPELADALSLKHQGVLIGDVIPNSPAAKSGIAPKDVVLSFNHVHIDTANQLATLISSHRPGSKNDLVIQRSGKTFSQSIVLKATLSRPSNHLIDGLSVMNNDELDSFMRRIHGVRVIDVMNQSRAWLSGILPGDVILAVDNHPIINLQGFIQYIRKHQSKHLVMRVKRQRQIKYFVISA